jgi:D-glycero-D-manno-heptose 1,7-bisphosphate phosphatase
VPSEINNPRPYPALFLDRDGVVNKEKGISWCSDIIEFTPGIFELVGEANRLGLRVVIVTNQSGIGRGLFSEAQFSDLMHWMCDQFLERGAHIDAVYFSPFHPTAGVGTYRRDSDCRKPNPGMFFSAMTDFDINLRASIMLGDNDSDMRAAAAAGIPHRWLVHSGQAARSVAATLVEVSLPMAREQLAMIYSSAN